MKLGAALESPSKSSSSHFPDTESSLSVEADTTPGLPPRGMLRLSNLLLLILLALCFVSKL